MEVRTNKKVNKSEIKICDSHDSFNNKHGIKVEKDFKNLHSIHWLPKVLKSLINSDTLLILGRVPLRNCQSV